MSYRVAILIIRENWLASPTPITHDDLVAWASKHPQYTLAASLPEGAIPITYLTESGQTTYIGQWEMSGTITAYFPSEDHLRHLLLIAQYFLADAIGENGERYSLDNDEVFVQERNSQPVRYFTQMVNPDFKILTLRDRLLIVLLIFITTVGVIAMLMRFIT